MIEIIAPIVWAGLIVYIVWYFMVAKHYAPLTRDEVSLLWKIHKQNAGCRAKSWKEIRHGRKIVGFECGCGYRHVQKRPIKSNMPAATINDQNSVLRELHKV